MCGRFTMIASDELHDIVGAVECGRRCRLRHESGARAQAFPGSMVSTIGRGHGEVETAHNSWGFPAEWSGHVVFNTRIESALGGSAMWRDAFHDGRCIIPAATFFEPHEAEKALSPRTGKLIKRPYEFADTSGYPLLLAGVADGGFCSVVTTEPNERVSPVHPRMPLILRFEEASLWLEGSSFDITELADRSQLDLTARPALDAAPTTQPHPDETQLSLF